MITLGTAATDVEHPTEKPTVTAAATTSGGSESTSGLMKQLLERMDRMEVELRQSKQLQAPRRRIEQYLSSCCTCSGYFNNRRYSGARFPQETQMFGRSR